MFQRSFGAPAGRAGGLSRQSSSELKAGAGAIPKGVARNDSFNRRAPAGTSGSAPQRQRSSILAQCLGSNGFAGDSDSFGEANFASANWEARSQPQPSHPSQPRAEGARLPDAAEGPPSPANAASTRPLNSSEYPSWDFSPEPFVPSPSNLPTNEDEQLLFPPRQLQSFRKDIWTVTHQPGIDLFLAGPKVWGRLHRIYVVLFGVGERDTEGIYSLRAYGTDGTPQETIIAFESEEDAQRYSCLLEASMEHTPHVCAIPPRELLSFCLDHCYGCRMEPCGSLLIPPDTNVTLTDWERSLRLRDGKFSVLDAEPELRRPCWRATRASAARTWRRSARVWRACCRWTRGREARCGSSSVPMRQCPPRRPATPCPPSRGPERPPRPAAAGREAQIR